MNKKERIELAHIVGNCLYGECHGQYVGVKLLDTFPDIQEELDKVKDYYAAQRIAKCIGHECFEYSQLLYPKLKTYPVDSRIISELVELWGYDNDIPLTNFVDLAGDWDVIRDVLLVQSFEDLIKESNDGDETFENLLNMITIKRGIQWIRRVFLG